MTEPFGAYDLHDRLGAGGMGEVWAATRRLPGGVKQDVVVKRIRAERAAEPGFAERFVAEARVAARLGHPNLVRVVDFGQVDDAWFLAMERVDGADLARVQRAAGGRLPPGIALYIAHEVARGLAAAHGLKGEDGAPLGLVHRDVCAANVLVGRDGQVKLADFGVAGLAGQHTGEVVGHLSTMSPEQVDGRPVDARSDVFSLGVVLYEMLVGEKLFVGRDPAALRAQIRGAVIPAPSSLHAGIPARVDAVVSKALARDPEARFASAASMRQALRDALSPGAPDLQAEALRVLLPGWLDGAPLDAEVAKTVLDTVSAPTVLADLAASARTEFVPAPAAETRVDPVVSAPEAVPPRPAWSERRAAVVVLLLVVVGWVGLQWLAAPYDGTPWVPPSTPLELVPFEPVEAGPATAPVPWREEGASAAPSPIASADPSPVASPAASPYAGPPAGPGAGPSERPGSPPVVAPAGPVDSVEEHTATSAAPPLPASEPPPADAAPTSTPTVDPTTPARVTVQVSSGWGKLRIDGKRVKGSTPLDVALAPGVHRIQIETPSTGRVYTREIEVAAGEQKTLTIEVD
jgi:hypothetical protein